MDVLPDPAEHEQDEPTREIDAAGDRLVGPRDDIESLEREDLSDEWQLTRCRTEQYGAYTCPVVGDYRLLRRLGRGGMGSVYSAVHPRLGTLVAVKVLHQHLAGRDASIRRRFEREAQIAAQLSGASPHLVRVHDVDHDSAAGCHFLVMEYIEGVAGEQWAHSVVESDGRTAELDVIDVCLAGTLGLVAAHRAGVVHRDVKPANILIPVTETGPALQDAKLADLGLARAEHLHEGLTAVGQMMLGTPGYAAPEQLERGTSTRKASDVFAMGATIYRLLTGHAPFSGATPMVRAVATISGDRKPLREWRDDVCDSVDALVDTCLQRDPDERFPDASALAEALQLCRSAIVSGDARVREIPSRVIDLVHRNEDGKSALSTYASRILAKCSRVLFDGGPPGATVVLSARDGAVAPLEYVLDEKGCREVLDVPIGTYRFVARHDDFEELTGNLSVRAGVDLNYPLRMRERHGYLAVTSDPAGAEVRLDGVRMGVTPLPRYPLPAGAHEVVVALDGHGPVVQKINVRGGRAADLGVIRLERRAKLDVSEHSADIVFALDGQEVADGAEVDPGVRRLTATRPGYESQALTVRVEPGALLKPALPRWRLNARALLESFELWTTAADADRRRAARSLAIGRADLEFLRIEDFACGAQSAPIALFRHLPTGLEMALVPGGSFAMGSPSEEEQRRSDERVHDVQLSPFLMTRTTIPLESWCAVMDEAAPSSARARHPAEVRAWARAAAFCQTAGLVLPTEAQWERCCRAGSPGAFAWGADAEAAASYADVDRGWGAPSRPVGERAPNAFGLYDTHGGVWEWCRDRYGEYPFDATVDPTGSSDGAYRVLRGGSRFDSVGLARAGHRCAAPPDVGVEPAGFRAVAEVHADDASDQAESSVAGMESHDA